MRKVFIYRTISIDGFIAEPDNELDWMVRRPDQELNDDIVASIGAADTGVIGYPTALGKVSIYLAPRFLRALR
jgi:hypothetical protein